MRREDAIEMIQELARGFGGQTQGLNSANFGGLQVDDAEVWFEFDPDAGALRCSALIYQFSEAPRRGLIEACQALAGSGRAEMGGGALEYQPENQGLYLTRVYPARVAGAEFEKDMRKLLEASQEWSEDTFARAAMEALGVRDEPSEA